MNRQDVIARTRAYVRENFLYMRPDFELAETSSLLETGVIDSLGVMELVEFIQEEFDVEIGDAEILEEHLGSFDAIARFVVSKQPQVKVA